jgi:hypothetical protein
MVDLKGNFTAGSVPPENINTKRHYFGHAKAAPQTNTGLGITGHNSLKLTKQNEPVKNILPTKSILHNKDTLQSSVMHNPLNSSLGQQYSQLKQNMNESPVKNNHNSFTPNNPFNNSTGLNIGRTTQSTNNPLSSSLVNNQNPLLNNTNGFNNTMQSAFNPMQTPTNYTNPYAINNDRGSNPSDTEMKAIIGNMQKLTQRQGLDLEKVLQHDLKDKQSIHKDVLRDYLSSTFLLDVKQVKQILDSLTFDLSNKIKPESFLNTIHKYHVPDIKNIFEDNILNDPMYQNIRYGEDSLLGDKQESWFTKIAQLLQNKHINLLSRLNAYDLDADGI